MASEGKHPRVDLTRGQLSLGTIQNGEKRAPIQLNTDGALEVEIVESAEHTKLLHDILDTMEETNRLLNDLLFLQRGMSS